MFGLFTKPTKEEMESVRRLVALASEANQGRFEFAMLTKRETRVLLAMLRMLKLETA